MRKSFFLVPLLALAMSSCSSDEPAVGGGETPDAQDGFYATVSFKLPTAGSRATGPNGTEEGKDFENNIGSILVILAEQDKNATTYSDANYTYVSYAYTDAPRLAGGTASSATKKYTINFDDKESLFKYAGTTPTGEISETHSGNEVAVFVYCNPSETLVNFAKGLAAADTKTFTDQMLNAAADVKLSWTNNSFLMTSVGVHTKALPSQEDLKTYNTENNAFPLTATGEAIDVMRTAVRFDFKDGSPETTDVLTYEIKDINDESKVQGTVTLTEAALFNVRDQFYYLPRLADPDYGTLTLCPGFTNIENGHMVSPAANRTYSEAITFGNDPLDPSKVDGLDWATLTNVLGLTEDTDGPWTHPGDEEGSTKLREGYHIWRYATENTFAWNQDKVEVATGTERYSRDETTGVVFKAEINVADKDKVEKGKPMFLYQGVIYPSAKEVYAAATEYPGTGLANAFEKVFKVTGEGETATVELNSEVVGDDDLEAEGFTIYRPDAAGKYYCYYYYFNKHNDNTNLAETTPFEFATVRNNVYKLSVTKINQFATFFPPKTVEDWNVFFTLNVEVRPWTVRVNDIEF